MSREEQGMILSICGDAYQKLQDISKQGNKI